MGLVDPGNTKWQYTDLYWLSTSPPIAPEAGIEAALAGYGEGTEGLQVRLAQRADLFLIRPVFWHGPGQPLHHIRACLC